MTMTSHKCEKMYVYMKIYVKMVYFCNYYINIDTCLNIWGFMKNAKFKYTLPGMIFIIFLISACSREDDRGYLKEIGDTVSDIEFQFADGTKASLYSLDSKIVVLQFTASWCSVCREEMPHLEKEVWQEFKDMGLMLIGVDYDEPLEKVKAFKEQMKVTYPMALDPEGKIFGIFANEGSGVTRNVVISMKTKKIIFLTRLYNTVEFSKMIKKIETSL